MNNIYNNLIYQDKINTPHKNFRPNANNNNQLPPPPIEEYFKQFVTNS